MKAYSPRKKQLCLVGGGHSHVTVIRQLALKPLPGIQVTLISPDIFTPYSGMLPGLIAGHYTHQDCHINLHRLCRWAGIQFHRGFVKRINPDLRELSCAQHPPIKYDLLSINIGSQPAIENILGANTFGYTIKPINNFLHHWQRWLEFCAKSKQKQHIVVVGGGAAGVEVLLAMHYRLRNTTSINAAFTLICSDNAILPSHNPAVQAFFLRHFQSLNIRIIKNCFVASIDRQQLQLMDGSSIDYDFTVWAIHAGAQTWPAMSGLKCDNHGFIEVDQFLRSTSHPNIFAVGDSAAFTPRNLPKAGVYAVRQGSVLFNNILATFKQQPLAPFKPQQRFLSLLTTGGHHAVASRGFIFFQGKWVWYWKNHIDQSFMNRFKI
ncbi:selenide, water dikinase [Nitrosomonas aestuarii]|uniref:Selenide, water dikinase n=1 Tax=Nitrosomonas aestuarii TaxID=52441 RepID=A0A1I4G5G4_9PROT|nr:FAD-dependent oxidoreductase [Nitrosomonas aestuarii]SFL25285.1 selenide, water dikinase [Nitrosomonas aestuarii]